jgi:hypothetical protein
MMVSSVGSDPYSMRQMPPVGSRQDPSEMFGNRYAYVREYPWLRFERLGKKKPIAAADNGGGILLEVIVRVFETAEIVNKKRPAT